MKMVLFLLRVFLITNSLKVVHLLSKMRLSFYVVFLSALKFVSFEVKNILILYFHIFQRSFEVLNAIFQVSVYLTIVSVIMYYNL